MKYQIAMVQPETRFGPGSRNANVEAAWTHAREAASLGASIVVFPESFPGEWKKPIQWTPENELRDIAAETGVFLVGGFAEPLDDDGVRCFNTLVLNDPSGREVGRYRRTTPGQAPWIYPGGEYWDFEWVNAVDLPVFETDLGVVGMAMCSEIYGPELFRILAVKGAELILAPSGLISPNSRLFQTWRTLVWARAIENLAVVAMSSNVTDPEMGGLAMVCSPEDILLEETGAGVFLAELNLDRIAELRMASDRRVGLDAPWKTKPGVLRDWRRPEVLAGNPGLLPGEGEGWQINLEKRPGLPETG